MPPRSGKRRARERRRLALTVFVVGVGVYAARAVFQFATLDAAALHWDFEQFYTAAQHLNHGASPYAGIDSRCGFDYCLGGYWYPPLFAEVLRPLALLPLVAAGAVWLAMLHGFAVASMVVGCRMLRDVVSRDTALLLTGLGLLYGPMYESLYFAQLGMPIVLLTLLAARGLQRDSPRSTAVAGTLLALATALKVAPGIAMASLAVPLPRGRGARTALVAASGSTVAFIGVMVAWTSATASYVTDVMPRLTSVTTATRSNESGPAMALRLLQLTGHVPAGRVVTTVTLGVVLGATALVALRARDAVPMLTRTRLVGLAAFTAATPIVTSITWPHYLAAELAVFVLIAVGIAPLEPGSPVRRTVLRLCAAGYVLTYIDRAMIEGVLGVVGWQGGAPGGPLGVLWVAIVHVNTIGMVVIWVATLLVLRARAPVATGGQ